VEGEKCSYERLSGGAGVGVDAVCVVGVDGVCTAGSAGVEVGGKSGIGSWCWGGFIGTTSHDCSWPSITLRNSCHPN
jgi:hypothetical protein